MSPNGLDVHEVDECCQQENVSWDGATRVSEEDRASYCLQIEIDNFHVAIEAKELGSDVASSMH